RQIANDVVPGNGVLHRGWVEEVDLDGRCAEGAHERRLLVVARHGRDLVAGGHQLPNRPLAQHAGCPGDEDPHLLASCSQLVPLMAASIGTCCASSMTRSPIVVAASSRRHASSARYMAAAIEHTGA